MGARFVLFVQKLFEVGRERSHFTDSFELDYSFGDVTIAEERGLNMLLFFELPQFILAGCRPFFQEDSFYKISCIESSKTILIFTKYLSISMQLSCLELTLVFGVVVIFAAETMKKLMEVQTVADELVLFVENET